AAQTAILSVDADGRFTHVNPFAEQLLGYAAADLVGHKTLEQLCDHDQLGRSAAALARKLERDVAPYEVFQTLASLGRAPREWRCIRHDGSAVPVLMAISPIRDDATHLLGLLVVATDLTEMKELEADLRKSEQRERDANRAKTAFLATM